MSTFFINAPFTVTQNASIYAQNVATQTSTLYDYIIALNFQSGSNYSMNALFNTKSYQQGLWDAGNSVVNVNAYNNVTINLTVNNLFMNTLFSATNAAYTTSLNTNISSLPAYNTLATTGTYLPYRLLEVVASKIFGNAKSQAAIANDNDFYQINSVPSYLLYQITNGINQTLQNTNMQLNIFNIYVGLDRIHLQGISNLSSIVDINQAANFNFNNTTWDFPLYLQVTLNNATTGYNNLALINNGPNIGGNVLTSGVMNVPILLRFSSAY